MLESVGGVAYLSRLLDFRGPSRVIRCCCQPGIVLVSAGRATCSSASSGIVFTSSRIYPFLMLPSGAAGMMRTGKNPWQVGSSFGCTSGGL